MTRKTLLEQYEEARRNRTPEQQAAIDDLHAGLYALGVDDVEYDARIRQDVAAVVYVAYTEVI